MFFLNEAWEILYQGKKNRVKLTRFDGRYWKKLPSDKNIINYKENSESNIKYHIISVGGKRCGIVKVIKSRMTPKNGRMKVYIEKAFRGMGLYDIIIKMVTEKYKFKDVTHKEVKKPFKKKKRKH